MICFEPAVALLGIYLLHLNILPDSTQDGTRSKPEQLVQLIFVSKNSTYFYNRHTVAPILKLFRPIDFFYILLR